MARDRSADAAGTPQNWTKPARSSGTGNRLPASLKSRLPIKTHDQQCQEFTVIMTTPVRDLMRRNSWGETAIFLNPRRTLVHLRAMGVSTGWAGVATSLSTGDGVGEPGHP